MTGFGDNCMRVATFAVHLILHMKPAVTGQGISKINSFVNLKKFSSSFIHKVSCYSFGPLRIPSKYRICGAHLEIPVDIYKQVP